METTIHRSAAQAPGCFGAASVFALDCDTCRACCAFEACREKAYETLMSIKERINVTDIIARHQKARLAVESARAAAAATAAQALAPAAEATGEPKPQPAPQPLAAVVERKTPIVREKFEISATDQACLDQMSNTKTRDVATTLARGNKLVVVKETLRRRGNPFAHDAKRYPALRVACDMLLTGGFTKMELARRMQSQLGWTEGTATSQRAGALNLLQALGVLQEDNGHFTLRLQ